METINVIVKLEKNWAGNQYLTYSTEKHGMIAELDYPDEDRKLPRVYAKNAPEPGYISFSCMRAGFVGAETACHLFLLDHGYDNETYQYPEGYKKTAFKWKRRYVRVADRIPSKQDMIKFIEKIAEDCGQVKLGSSCGKYFNVLYYRSGSMVESFEGEYGYGFTKLRNKSYRIIKKIYEDIKQDFSE